jgi:uncharacterized membrane protein YkoI
LKFSLKNWPSLSVINLVILIALIGGGAAMYAIVIDTDSQKRETTEPESNTLKTVPSTFLTLDELKEIVSKDQESSQITGIGLAKANGVLVYQVKLNSGEEVAYDAKSGAQVTGVTSEIDSANLPPELGIKIDFNKAREIALSKKPDGIVHKIVLEFFEGELSYSVRFIDGSRVDVNAVTGEILGSWMNPSAINKANAGTDNKPANGRPKPAPHSQGTPPANQNQPGPEVRGTYKNITLPKLP